MGFPQGWTDVCWESQDLQIGYVHPQSPALIGSLVMKLQRLRRIVRRNIANSMQNTLQSEDNRQSKLKL